MRALGYQAVDLLVERLSDPSIPALRRATPAEMAQRVSGPPPAAPRPFEDVLAQLSADVLPYMNRADHPRFFAFIPSCQTFPGALGDFIASALNVYVGSWMEAAGPSQVELTVLDWFREWMGLPGSASGVLVSGGSAANMTALACARESLLGPMTDRVVAYVSDQAHSSLARAARLLGFRPDQLRVLPAGPDLRLSARTLSEAIAADVDGRPRAAVRVGVRRFDEHGRGRSPGGAGRRLPRARRVDARRCGLRRVRGADHARPRGACAGSRAPTRSPWIRTSGSTSRWSAERCWCATASCCGGRSRSCRTT